MFKFPKKTFELANSNENFSAFAIVLIFWLMQKWNGQKWIAPILCNSSQIIKETRIRSRNSLRKTFLYLVEKNVIQIVSSATNQYEKNKIEFTDRYINFCLGKIEIATFCLKDNEQAITVGRPADEQAPFNNSLKTNSKDEQWENLFLKFNPKKVLKMIKEKSFTEVVLNRKVGTFKAWDSHFEEYDFLEYLNVWILFIEERLNLSVRLSKESLFDLTETITMKYGDITVLQFGEFVNELFSGKYGKITYSINSSVILKSLDEFVTRKNKLIIELEEKKKRNEFFDLSKIPDIKKLSDSKNVNKKKN